MVILGSIFALDCNTFGASMRHNKQLSPKPLEMPETTDRGMVPTLNNKGFMSMSLDPVSAAFTMYAGQSHGLSLDLGCAYGIATLAALDHGARVIACDMDPGHVQVLLSNTTGNAQERVSGIVAEMPQVAFKPNSLSAILCSRALHFLNGEDVTKSVKSMADWLASGGKLFLITDTPYTGFWARGAAAYEERKAAGEAWPGFIPDVTIYLPEQAQYKPQLRHLNPMDPDILSRVCRESGLIVEHASFSGRPDQPNAKTHAGVIASKIS